MSMRPQHTYLDVHIDLTGLSLLLSYIVSVPPHVILPQVRRGPCTARLVRRRRRQHHGITQPRV